MATVLVIGASRGIGLETVKAALAAGHTVRALARSADAISVNSPQLEKVSGDALDKATVERALDGVDVVVQSLGASSAADLIRGTTLFSRATRTLIDAMRAKGVRRLLTVTGFGAGDSRGHGGVLYDAIIFPLVLKRVYDDKDVQEQMIRASGLEWTIARPGLLTNGPATGRYQVLTDPATGHGGAISRADVADFLVREITARACIGQTPLLIA